MNQRKRNVAKAVVAVALLLAAGFLTMVLRDLLSMRNPENVLPKMEVWHTARQQRERLGDHYTLRDAYTWQFLFGGPVAGGGLDLEAWREIQPADVEPNTRLELTFSFGPKWARVYMTEGNSGLFVEQSPSGGTYTYPAPSEQGVYTYRVEANFGTNKDVVYYFRVNIPDW